MLTLSFKNSLKEESLIQKVDPTFFKPIKSSLIDTLEYIFKYDEQLFFEECMKKHKKSKEKKQINNSFEKISYSEAKQYVNFLEDIPNFKFKLTKQQKDVVGEDGNLIVIGRSGTGKTLLSIIRLYAMEFLKKQACFVNLAQEKSNKCCIYLELNKMFE